MAATTAIGGFLSTYGATIAAGASALGAVGSVAMAAKAAKNGGPELQDVSNKQVNPNDEAALRAAQDMARKRKGIAANLLSDGVGGTAGSVSVKTALGQ